ncbi:MULTISPECIES: aminodeoxychorismate synthase component I [unclassified Peribacillus]|uniref:aminodeoxychorismate synthase component I n=1 Tax=unclassified Peribacillus TaxID=2675266 RepID=UPI0019141C5C|nr:MULTISPECIES: aminodeoxychorismate synthase component I [unclassified Peribacillus]MBK5441914.1 aminodeoxychorismate synthase component I [Peribacillus sp. TH24]MBK5463308.1 aminodeoxychorismate synthase component I [Peribacillus sp. TH27]MBK5501552.1 aminodeoxychorismate synthase component I [Peribacillus sp. TH14]WMX53517.1 aminodeoxychorismate synthase component I [Peribacillus sp. R9-11]
MKQEEPLSLLFHFTDKQDVKKPLYFTEPKEVFIAHSLQDVLPQFQKVQAAIEQGYYAAGYVSYEAAPAFEKSFKVKEGAKMPLLWFGIFEKPEEFPGKITGSFQLNDWESETDSHTYHSGFQTIKAEIEKGNTYQVNYTMRLQSMFEGDDFAFYDRLKRAQRSNYSAFLNIGTHRILSASPELFFRWVDGQLITRPMKGTVKRGITVKTDQANADWLACSEKNQAENLMIVDLLRNDLGMIAEQGSVQVPKLKEIEKYPTVWQMTSTITAKTKPKTTIIDIFKALFPCGSITGAPKIKTMKIITELENSPREVYCGAIGFITPECEAVFNVPIRTVVIEKETGKAEYGVGGGITWDSVLLEEYDEAFLKAKLLSEERPTYQLLESIKLEDGQYFLLDEHIDRMMQSAGYFDYPFSETELRNKLQKYADSHYDSMQKVRVLLFENGDFEVSGQIIKTMEAEISAIIAESPISTENPFLYHKTTNREVYEKFQTRHPEFYDVLLWNEQGYITEFTNGNVVVKINGDLFTPPVESGLLAGTFRQELLRKKEIKEKLITKADLHNAEEVWFINSVRRGLKVNLTF